MGVAVRRHDGGWSVLTGNQIASILLYSLLSERQRLGTLPRNGLVVRSIVSTRLSDAICAHFGVALKEVLTGFRFISQQIAQCEETGEHTFLFGFEESYGYLAGGFSRDKDAICSAMLVAQAAIRYRQRGMTLYDALQELYAKFGFFGEGAKSYTLEGKVGLEKIAAAMEALRKAPPAALAGQKVVQVLDYENSAVTKLPPSNVLRLTLEDGDYAMVRPSGTEPKLKLYTGSRAPTQEILKDKLSALEEAMEALLFSLLQ